MTRGQYLANPPALGDGDTPLLRIGPGGGLQSEPHPRSAAVPYYTAKTLPASGAPTDPNLGGAIAGNGLPIPVPAWATSAMIFAQYANGVGSTTGSAAALVFVGPAIGAPVVSIGGVGSGSIDTNGVAIPVSDIGGAATIGVQFSETGNTAQPGAVTVNVVFH